MGLSPDSKFNLRSSFSSSLFFINWEQCEIHLSRWLLIFNCRWSLLTLVKMTNGSRFQNGWHKTSLLITELAYLVVFTQSSIVCIRRNISLQHHCTVSEWSCYISLRRISHIDATPLYLLAKLKSNINLIWYKKGFGFNKQICT